MNILLSGASGFIGTALVAALRGKGHRCVCLIRRAPSALDEIQWEPRSGILDPEIFKEIDGVINLCGRNIADKRWSPSFRQELYESRIIPTRTLARSLAALKDRRRFFISASAIGFYGSTREGMVDEDSSPGDSFFGHLGELWEHEALSAASDQLRVVCPRLGIVLDKKGGALGKMLPVFKVGLGGRLGSGAQFFSWISLEDTIRAFEFVIRNDAVSGAVNFTSPNPVTNSQFTAALSATLKRPAFFPVPSQILNLVFGATFAQEALLSNLRVHPVKLQKAGFIFNSPEAEEALNRIVNK